MNSVISCQNIVKEFDGIRVLDGVSFEVTENSIYGLLGRNGAGKTTLLKIITDQMFLTEGTVEVYGENPHENERVLKEVCFVRENVFCPKGFKVSEVLNLGRSFYSNWNETMAKQLIGYFELDINKKFYQLSKGMQSTVAIIIGLASRAPITIYDEAYLGLDAPKRELFYEIVLKDYDEHPRTIIFSSHLIDECSSLLEKVIILNKGKVLLTEDADLLRERAFLIAGRKDKLAAYLQDKRVLHKEEIGKVVSVAVFGQISLEEQRKMTRDEIELQSLPLQKLFIYLTSNQGGDYHEFNAAAV